MSETVTQQQVAPRPARMIFTKLIVSDLAAMQDFYLRAFGLVNTETIEMEHLIEAVLRRPGDDRGFSLVLYQHKDGRELVMGNSHGPLGLLVDNVDKTYAHAVAQGAKPHRAPYDLGASRIAFVLDPDGHEIEIIRAGPPKD